MASQKMFPCVVSEHTESKEGKHSLLQTTCNRFFLKPNKSTLRFRSCDTFCALCYSQHILFHPPPPRTHPPQAAHTHTQSEFPFPVRKITCTDRMACFNATCSGRKTGKGVQGCPTWNTRRVRGNPALVAALQFLETVSKVSSVFVFFVFFALALPSCALLLLVQECCRSMICLLQNNTYCIFQCKLMGSQGNTEYSLTFYILPFPLLTCKISITL